MYKAKKAALLALLCGVLSACQGYSDTLDIGASPGGARTPEKRGESPALVPGVVDPGKGPGPVIAPNGQCAEAAEQVSELILRKMTRVEYVQALERAFPKESMDQVRAILNVVPSDDPDFKSPPSQFTPGISRHYAAGTFDVSHQIASHVVREPGQLGQIGPTCLGTAPDAACLETFVRAFGLKLYGREVADEEVQGHLETWRLDTEGVSSITDRLEVIVASMLNSPEFIWVIPDQEAGTLTPDAIAERLSFAAWGMAPDAGLVAAARQGELGNLTSRREHAARLLNTPQGRKHAAGLIARWFDIEREIDLNPSARFLALKIDGLYDDMTKESADYIEHVIFEQQGSYQDLMTSPLEFPSTAPLATVMGHDKPVAGPVDSKTGRAGMLARPALLVHVYDRPAPIHRAAVILFRVLCRENLPVPQDANDVANERLDEIGDASQFTARQLAQKVTAGACESCHSFINPLGFALAGFGPVGQAWEQETVWDSSRDELTVLNELPVDATVALQLDGATREITGPAELGRAIARSQEGQACAAKQVFRITHLREPVAGDACHIKSLEQALEQDQPLFDILVLNAAEESIRIAPRP